ncbi:SDR family NAD(P)-dependent oxidoreductase [Sphingobacterium gobiense]|uniref:Short-chain dehydrogenase n=1 Tax=Sphingobacterium gobiense TaxID=1382456 RepID=A0A2S9JUQ8_9SPHI|nr:SDR family oxidoreductase [Sphingobacterium gobiense]PRD57017.1 short-chain dehydrogenase [Sphingobacterium gobiense]
MSKIAFVTGGSRGLGKDMALRIAENGLDVILTYKSNKDEATKVVEAIEAKGQQAFAIQLDTSKTESFDSVIAEVRTSLKQKRGQETIDFLVNNAGIGLVNPITETTEEQFDTLSNIHLKGVFFLTQKLIPLLNPGGGIINVSSGLARFSMPGYAAYAMMKGGIEVFSRYLAKELGSKGIRANTIAPGAIETDFGGGAVRDNEQYNKAVSSVTALGRAGLAEDIGGVVAFLCTEDARWINAQRIEVSGGMNI